MTEYTRAFDPGFIRDLRATNHSLDKMGIFGHSIFYCSGYTAPAHTDKDLGRGLSYQVDLKAGPGEFGFCYLYFGIWMEAHENSAW